MNPTLLHLQHGVLQALHARSQAHRDQLSDAVSMAIDHILSGAASVVSVQRGGTLQTDGEVAGLAEEPQLLTRVQAAEDGPAQRPAGLQVLQTLDGVRRRPLLTPADRER